MPPPRLGLFAVRSGLMFLLLLEAILPGRAIPSAPVPKPQGPYYGVFRELPITGIEPQGWLAEFLRRQRDGLALHREASGFPFNTNLWVGKIPDAKWPAYEQTAYFLDGAYRCGLLLQDKPLMDLGRQNVAYVLDHPSANGLLGPGPGDYLNTVAPDDVAGPRTVGIQWPFVVFTRALIADYGATHNPKILEELTTHYLALPTDLGKGPRDVDVVEGMCWLYGQTGDQRILDTAIRVWSNATVKPGDQWKLNRLIQETRMHGHGVSVSEETKQPALLYLYTGTPDYLKAAVGGFSSLERDHELVDGVLTSDSGLSGKDPNHQHETCVITDYTWSLGYLLMATGDSHWADTIERAIFNAGFSVVDKQFKSLQYYGSPNQVIATQSSNVPTVGKPNRYLQAYRPDFKPECCTGNVERMIPNYAARTWLSDGKGGLVAALYAPVIVHARVGTEEIPVTVSEKTDYPFDGHIELTIHADQPVGFPIYLRIPGWAEGATVTVNQVPVSEPPKPGTFLKIDRTFASGDVITLNFPMPVRMETPVAHGLSLTRGPLLFALNIKADRKKIMDTLAKNPEFPAWDLRPASVWNYSLALKDSGDLHNIKVSTKPVSVFPWTPETSPVTLTVPARLVKDWDLTPLGKNPPLPEEPLVLQPETEQIELIPDGATQLRISVFPAESGL